MHAVKSRARKQNVGLTVTKATQDARKVVDKVMPGVGATVESRPSYDMLSDRAVIITTITFPETADSADVACWAERAPGVIRSSWGITHITITRAVAR